MLWFMVICCISAAALGHVLTPPVVVTSQGSLRGQLLKSRGRRDYAAFTRVPFAKPPVGPLRFLPPEPAEKWSGVLDATQPTPNCYQMNRQIKSAFNGQEDCLYLDIYTPNITHPSSLPVIFSIYGGGFIMGSAGPPTSSKNFMDEDVVLVTPNYRVGTLGFLSTEDEVISGNMGLKDQALALEWVKKEIGAFGGDPGLITVIGESAGGASSHIICSAPRTAGLIAGCVSQSGVGWASWAFQKPGNARQRAYDLAVAVGCTADDLLRCLQSKPVEAVSSLDVMSKISYLPVSPVLESSSVPGALITKWPEYATQFPWITGVTHDEGLLVTLKYELEQASVEETENFINSFEEIIIQQVGLVNNSRAVKKIKERFAIDGVKPLLAMRNFFTEYMFVYPALKALSLHKGEKRFYKFNYIGGPNTFNSTNISGVAHGAEMPYFFNGTHNQHPSAPGWPNIGDILLSELLVRMWANFAQRQSPNIELLDDWPLFSEGKYFDISNKDLTMMNDDKYQEVLRFWDSIQ